jgi:hypothetical protein
MAYCYVCVRGDSTDLTMKMVRGTRCGARGNTKPAGYKPPPDQLEPEPGKTQTYCYVCEKLFNATYEDDGSLRCPDCGRSNS